MTTGTSFGGSPPSDPVARESLKLLASLLFAEPGRVVELRALKVDGVRGNGTASGYFDDPKKFVDAALSLDGRAQGVYATLNEVKPELLARANNRVVSNPQHATAKTDIRRRRHLLIDADPRRPSGISSTNAELGVAIEVANQIATYLSNMGFPAPARGLSGNGAHLLYAVDLPADDGELISRVLQALAFIFNNVAVNVDISVAASCQITKAYGTMVRKGDPVADRPHRRSSLEVPESGLQIVPESLLQRLATVMPVIDMRAPVARPNFSGQVDIDIDAILAAAGLGVARSGPWNGGTRWIFTTCPFNAEHTNQSAYVLRFASGALAAGCHHNSCQANNWTTLRSILEPYWPRSLTSVSSGSADRIQVVHGDGARVPSVSFGSAFTETSSATKWPEPQPLPSDLVPVAEFDFALLPESLRGWVKDISDRMQCPPDFVAVSVMVALGGVVGRRVGIRPMRRNDWLVVANLWGAVIGRPGILKSPAIQEALKPLHRLEIEEKRKFAAAVDERLQDSAVTEARRKVAQEKVRKAVKAGEDAEKVAEEVADDLKEPEIPVRRRYLVNDSTVEKLGEILNENPLGVVCYRDELIGFLKSLDKDGQESARAFYLEAWNGNGRFTYDRIARGTVDIEAATVSIIGGIQPGPLRRYLNDAMTASSQDDGFIQRFQLAVWPDTAAPWRHVDRWPDAQCRNAAFQVFRDLSELDATEAGAELDQFDPDGIPFVRFAPSAQEKFDAWREQLEIRIRASDEHPAIESHLAKYRSLLPSLALLIHLANGKVASVSEQAFDQAHRWVDYLETHAHRIYGVAVNPDLFAARAVSRKIRSRALTSGFTARDVYRKGWANLQNKEVVEKALAVLIDHDWLRDRSERTAGAPRTVYEINPRVFDLDSPSTDTTDRGSTSGSSVSAQPDAISTTTRSSPSPHVSEVQSQATDITATSSDSAPSVGFGSAQEGLFDDGAEPLIWEDLG